MKKTQTNLTTPNTTETPQAISPTQDEIARRAHELWLQDGCPTGRAVYHWHEAERQLQKEKTKQSSATNKTSSIPTSRSLESMIDDSSPYNALEKEAPLSVKVDRSLAKTNIKSSPSSSGSVNID